MEALLPFVASKLDQVYLVNDLSYCKDWLYGQWQIVCFVIKSYDEAQASTLTNENKRFKAELELAIHAEKVLHQVIDEIVFESKLPAEVPPIWARSNPAFSARNFDSNTISSIT